jgi:hypothetical protein
MLFWTHIVVLPRLILYDFFLAKISPKAKKIAQMEKFCPIWSPCAQTQAQLAIT